MLTLKDLDSFNEDGDIRVNERALEMLGGVAGVCKGVGTSLDKGLSGVMKLMVIEDKGMAAMICLVQSQRHS